MKILCAGDSITYGTGSTPGNSYPEILKRYMEERSVPCEIVQAGMPGFSTREYLDYVRSCTNSADPEEGSPFRTLLPYDAIIVMLGTNDCRFDNWVETADSMEYLDTLTGFFTGITGDRRDRIYLCSILPLADPMPPDILGGHHGWMQSRVENEINPGIKRMAQRYGMRFIDVHNSFQEGLSEEKKLYDGIHPYDSGYALIARVIGEAICCHDASAADQ